MKIDPRIHKLFIAGLIIIFLASLYLDKVRGESIFFVIQGVSILLIIILIMLGKKK